MLVTLSERGGAAFDSGTVIMNTCNDCMIGIGGLASTVSAELSRRGVIRISNVGTLRVREKRIGKLVTFDPSHSLSPTGP